MDIKTIGAAAGGVLSIGTVAFLGLRSLDPPPSAVHPAIAPVAVAVDASAPARMTSADQSPVTARDAGTPLTGIVRLLHATCGLGFFDADAGVRRVDSDAGRLPGRAIDHAFQCEVPDGGVAWSFIPDGEDSQRTGTLMALVFAAERRRNPARVRREVETMEREARDHPDRWAVPGLLFRAPERARGRLVRIEGVAHDVGEAEGRTNLTVSIDAVGREVIRVVLPDIADDRVVNGAEVVVYGIANGSHIEATRFGQEVAVPDVIAAHIDPQADASGQAEADRMLRRLRRHRY